MKNYKDFIEDRLKFDSDDDNKNMSLAIRAAIRAKSKGDVAIAATLAWPDASLVEHDTTYSEKNIIYIAETNLLRKLSPALLRKINEAVLYVTLEPSSSAALLFYENGIKEIVFGAYNYKDGFVSSPNALDFNRIHLSHKGGLLAEQCYDILPDYVKSISSIKPIS